MVRGSDTLLSNADVSDIAECSEGILLALYNGTLACLDKEKLEVKWVTEDIARHWCKQFALSETKQTEFSDAINQAVIDWIGRNGEPLPGVHGALQWLQNSGLKVALASSSNMQVINAVLDKLNLHDYFISVNSANELEYGKPHPMVYLNTARKLGISPLDCMAIEDSVNGVIAGKAAQMDVVAIPPKVLQGDLRYSIANRQLDSLLELPALLHNIMIK